MPTEQDVKFSDYIDRLNQATDQGNTNIVAKEKTTGNVVKVDGNVVAEEIKETKSSLEYLNVDVNGGERLQDLTEGFEVGFCTDSGNIVRSGVNWRTLFVDAVAGDEFHFKLKGSANPAHSTYSSIGYFIGSTFFKVKSPSEFVDDEDVFVAPENATRVVFCTLYNNPSIVYYVKKTIEIEGLSDRVSALSVDIATETSRAENAENNLLNLCNTKAEKVAFENLSKQVVSLNNEVGKINLITDNVKEGERTQKQINESKVDKADFDGYKSSVNDEIESFEAAVRLQVGQYRPVTIEGDVVNAADEEDLTSENGLLKIKNRNALDGLGYVVVRKGRTFAEQIVQSDTIYEVRYDIDLDDISNLRNVTIILNGGSLYARKDVVFSNVDGFKIYSTGHGKVVADPSLSESGDGIISFISCENISIEGLTFVYNNVYKNFVYTNSCRGLRIVNNVFGGLTQERIDKGWKKCVYSVADENIFVSGNVFKDVHGGLTLGNYMGIDKNVVVVGNVFENAYVSAINTFVENGSFSSNVFRNVGYGGNVTGIAICGSGPINGYEGCYSSDVSVVGNSFFDCCNAVQADCANFGYVTNITIVGNSVKTCDRAFYMANTKSKLVVCDNIASDVKVIALDLSNVSEAIVDSNIFECTSARYGTRITPYENGEFFGDVKNVTIKNSLFSGCQDGIYIGQSANNVSEFICLADNHIKDCSRGVVATDNTRKLKVVRNRFENNVVNTDIRTESKNVELLDGFTNTSGTSVQRPTLSNSDEGFMYFDSTLKKYIIWDGYKWTDAVGNDIAV